MQDEINQLAVDAMLGGTVAGVEGAGVAQVEEAHHEEEQDAEQKEFWVKALEAGGPHKGEAYWDRPLQELVLPADGAVEGKGGEEEEEGDDDEGEDEGAEEAVQRQAEERLTDLL